MNDEEGDVVFEPLHVNEWELEKRKEFDAFIDHLKAQMAIELSVPANLYRIRSYHGETSVSHRMFLNLIR